MSRKLVRQNCARNATGDHRQKRSEFEHPVAPRKFGLRQQFWQQSVFRRSKKRGLHTRKKHRGHFQIQVLPAQSRDGQSHYCHLEKLGPDSDRTFAVTIREKSARH